MFNWTADSLEAATTFLMYGLALLASARLAKGPWSRHKYLAGWRIVGSMILFALLLGYTVIIPAVKSVLL